MRKKIFMRLRLDTAALVSLKKKVKLQFCNTKYESKNSRAFIPPALQHPLLFIIVG